MERRYPVIVRAFHIRDGSGGAGEYQGGCGVVREIEFVRGGVRVSVLSERRAVRPFGLKGGGSGKKGVNLWGRVLDKKAAEEVGGDKTALSRVVTGGADELAMVRGSECMCSDGIVRRWINIGGKCAFEVACGDRVRLMTPGAGAYGEKK